LSIQIQEASRKPNKLDQNRAPPCHIIINTTSTENSERILKAVCKREKITCNDCLLIKITADFSAETLKARRAWSKVI
jgi:hypothetical protein